MSGGSIVIDGISVTANAGHNYVRFTPGSRYLVLVTECGARSAALALGGFGVFVVDRDDSINSLSDYATYEYASQLRALGTLARVRAYFREKNSGNRKE